jgi:hypothetical protein
VTIAMTGLKDYMDQLPDKIASGQVGPKVKDLMSGGMSEAFSSGYMLGFEHGCLGLDDYAVGHDRLEAEYWEGYDTGLESGNYFDNFAKTCIFSK